MDLRPGQDKTLLVDRANEPLPPASKCSPSSLTLDNDPWWLARTFLSLGSITHSEPERKGRVADFLLLHLLISVSKVLMTLTGTFHPTRDLERGSFMFHFLPECSLNLPRHRQHPLEMPFAFFPRWKKCGECPSVGLPYAFRRFGAGHTGDLAQSWSQKCLH